MDIYTAAERLYLDSAGRVVKHDSPAKVSLLVAQGGTLPMSRARALGLVSEPPPEPKRREPSANKRKIPAENK